ncbi:MAG TPA: 5-guanidino-2-oxopentanoate decarboxylase [Steroidobacteraceae bacterium]|jgi:5-guanidino-2-oxopentanoate decarboxylase|nr:5-guanidino-2-oxopentanoate decarboxylase [Steroidobacteraceae bacterium]
MSRNVGCYLVELLAANDIDTVFGIPGVHNLELYRGLASTDIRHVLVRHEQGAGFAADGFARLSGRPAAAFVISGPGLTNIMTAVAQAYSDSVPLLVVASSPVRASFTKQWGVLHELYDQAALAAGVFGIARVALNAEDVRDHLRLCLASFRMGRPRPAYLEIPLDVLAETTALEAERFEVAPLFPQSGPEQIDAAVRVLSLAARPLIIAGGGARRSGAELHRLVETLDCPLVTTAAGKGVLAESHPANFGTSLPLKPIQQLIADADAVLAVGTELGETDMYFTTKLPLGGVLIRIDIDPVKLSDQYAADVCVWSDARSALQAINQALASRAQDSGPLSVTHSGGRSGWRTAIGGAAKFRAELEGSFDSKARAQWSALRAIKAALPWDGVVFSDMTQIAYFGNYAYPVDNPGQWFHPSGYGTLGFALPAALGAKISSPARAVIALAGDFGLQFTLLELMTAVEVGVSLPVVVWNNSALGQIRDDMVAAGIPQLGVIARNPDFVALAHACGAEGSRVHDAAALTETLRNALHRPGPTLIEVVASSFGE